jgi:hypothetical protein
MGDGLSVKVTPLTRQSNYRQWAAEVEALLTVNNRLDKLLSTPPDGRDLEVERDIQCKARLTLYVSGPLREVVARAGTAKGGVG